MIENTSFETVLRCCRASRGMVSTPDNISNERNEGDEGDHVCCSTLHNTNNERDEGERVCSQSSRKVKLTIQ